MGRVTFVTILAVLLGPLPIWGQTLAASTDGVVPVVAHLPGAEGSLWRTNLYAVQVEGSAPALLDLTLLNPEGEDWSSRIELGGSGSAVEIDDVVAQVAPDAPDGKYILVWHSTQPVVLTTRTFTIEESGSYGQGIGSLEPGTGFQEGGSVIFPAPVDSGTHRVNLGVANSSSSLQQFTATLMDSSGQEVASWEFEVPAESIYQFRTNQDCSGAGSVKLTCTSGCDGGAFGYMSVVVNDSNDAFFQYEAPGYSEQVAEVSIARDEQGVWYITGGTAADVAEAMGYAVATDRLWQMEVFRRMARGTMAEVFGSDYVAQDMVARNVGYTEAELKAQFEALPSRAKTFISAYVQGVNRRISEVLEDRSKLPFEFVAVGSELGIDFVPSYWTETDVLCWMSTLLRYFDSEAMDSGQIENAALLEALTAAFGAETASAMFADLRWLNDPAAQTMIPSGEKGSSHMSPLPNFPALANFHGFVDVWQQLSSLRKKTREFLESRGLVVKMGSYAWAVSGSRTTSGNPVLYSGPQMGFSAPAIVLEGSIVGGGLTISGMTVAGIPGIIIGRTPHHAWSMQVGHAHTVDYYVEPPDNLQLESRTEVIHVAGSDDVTFNVYRSQHGPIVYPFPFDPSSPVGMVISWKYAHWGKEAETMDAFLDLATATSVEQFGNAIERVALSQHFCYVDRDGNIAYWMSGMDPIRPGGIDPRFPLMGDGTQEWPEPVTYRPKAHAVNPEQGYFGGWNNKAEASYDNPPNNIWYQNGVAHRAHVIKEYFDSHPQLSYDEIESIALFIATTDSFAGGGIPWHFVRDYFVQAVEDNPTEAREEAIQLLENWDGHFVDGGESQWVDGLFRADAWVLEEEWVEEVLRLVFEDEFSAAGLDWEDQPQGVLFNVLLHALAGDQASIVNRYDWFQDVSGSGKPTDPEAIIVTALDNVLDELGPRPWNWARGRISYVHPILGEVSTTPYANRSTYAHCVEYGESGPVRIESMFPLGESGEILADPSTGLPMYNENFFSMKPYFDTFTHREFPLFQ